MTDFAKALPDAFDLGDAQPLYLRPVAHLERLASRPPGVGRGGRDGRAVPDLSDAGVVLTRRGRSKQAFDNTDIDGLGSQAGLGASGLLLLAHCTRLGHVGSVRPVCNKVAKASAGTGRPK